MKRKRIELQIESILLQGMEHDEQFDGWIMDRKMISSFAERITNILPDKDHLMFDLMHTFNGVGLNLGILYAINNPDSAIGYFFVAASAGIFLMIRSWRNL